MNGTEKSSNRNTLGRAAAWAILVASLVSVILVLWLTRLNHLEPKRYFSEWIIPLVLGTIAYSAMGALIIALRPANRIGWLIAITGISEALVGTIHQYVRYTLVTNPGSLPGGALLAWMNIWLWVPQTALFVIFLPLFFPNGRLPSPRWRLALWLLIATTLVFTFTIAVSPGAVDASLAEVQNPYSPAWAAQILPWLTPVSAVLTLFSLGVAVAAPVTRMRRAVGVERQQMKWFAYAAGVMVLCYLIPIFVYYPIFTQETWLSGVLLSIGIPVLPVAVGMALLRYRLYDIDFLIRRTLVYSVLTSALALVYFASVLVFQEVFRALTGSTSALAVVASTLLMAALFSPLRARIQRAIDRVFYRQKYDSAHVLDVFSAQSASEVDLERLSALLMKHVEQSIHPESVTIWLKKT